MWQKGGLVSHMRCPPEGTEGAVGHASFGSLDRPLDEIWLNRQFCLEQMEESTLGGCEPSLWDE